MSVTALVINFNAGDALSRCIQSLCSSSVKAPIKVMDNASTDGSAENLRSLYGNRLGVEILSNAENLGFARAVNAVMRNLDSDYVLLMNPDCVIDKDALELLIKALDADSSAGLAAPLVQNERGKPEKAALRRFPDPWNALMTFSGLWRLGRWVPLFKGVPFSPGKIPEDTVRAEAVSGACMLIRHETFMQVGMMDEAYGLHCEDLDLMYRMRQVNRHCLFVPGAKATHEQGVSSRSRPLWVHRKKHEGMARFFSKFQAEKHSLPFRWLVHMGIWLHYLLLLPMVWLRK